MVFYDRLRVLREKKLPLRALYEYSNETSVFSSYGEYALTSDYSGGAPNRTRYAFDAGFSEGTSRRPVGRSLLGRAAVYYDTSRSRTLDRTASADIAGSTRPSRSGSVSPDRLRKNG